MKYVSLNDASLFELVDLIEEGTTRLKGETLKAITMTIQGATLEAVKAAFASEFNTRTVTLMSENKIPMTVYDGYTILRSIATDEANGTEEAPLYIVTLAQSSDLGTLVPKLQDRLAELEASYVKMTATPDTSAMDLSALKQYQIQQSKVNLETFLASNPIESSCHGEKKRYACTLEKQTLLNNAIAMATIHAQLKDGYKISYNASGEVCTYDWTIEQLTQLAVEIEAFVKPLISQQQSMEAAIDAAGTRDDVLAVSISFGSTTL